VSDALVLDMTLHSILPWPKRWARLKLRVQLSSGLACAKELCPGLSCRMQACMQCLLAEAPVNLRQSLGVRGVSLMRAYTEHTLTRESLGSPAIWPSNLQHCYAGLSQITRLMRRPSTWDRARLFVGYTRIVI